MNVGGNGEAQLWRGWVCGWPGVCNFVGEGGAALLMVLPTVCGRNGEIELVLRTDEVGKGKENGMLY